MKNYYSPILFIFLLTGCNLPHSQRASSDAQQFVDAQILTHQQVIELSQNALIQASVKPGTGVLTPESRASR
jgi:uncharacterized protein YcfL